MVGNCRLGSGEETKMYNQWHKLSNKTKLGAGCFKLSMCEN